MLLYYLKYRLKPLHFFVLSLLMFALIWNRDIESSDMICVISFFFFSLLAFRFLDDAGSVSYDRKHFPERIYLNKENYTKYLVLTTLVLLIYFCYLFFFQDELILPIGILIVGSIVLYLVFHRVKLVLLIIPLLKYPALVGLINPKETIIPTMIGVLILMILFEFMDEYGNKVHWLVYVTLTLFCGGALFLPYIDQKIIWSSMIFVPAILVVIIKNKNNLKYLLLFYFPLAVFLNNLIQ